MTSHLTVGQPLLTLPDAIVAVLIPFATLFQGRTWCKAKVLLVGAVLTPGQRTVAAALRVMGLSSDRNYARYHHVLNRSAWSPLEASQVLLRLLLQDLDRGDGPLVFGIDETLERRQGPKISALGVYRDAVRSSRVNADGDLTHDRRSGIDPPPLLSVTAGLELTRRSGYYWASPN